jgi:hypothetical protein
MAVGAAEVVQLPSGATASRKRFLSDAQCKQSAVRILAEIESHAKGQRWATSLFYGDFEAVKKKIERLYHSEESALIMAYMEKLTGEEAA